jgi:phage portal protein BeeE
VTTPTPDVQYQLNVLAWLHNELVFEIQKLIATATAAVPVNVNPAHAQELRRRAIRIAQIRAEKAPTQ